MTLDTLLFLRDLLSRVNLQASSPDLVAQARRIERVCREVDEAITAAEAQPG